MPPHDAARPPVDVVVPFLGDDAELDELLQRLSTLSLRPDDKLLVVDNRPAAEAAAARPNVIRAPSVQSSYHARNHGARRGHAPWLLFLDGDVLPPTDLVDRYFAEPVDDRVAVLAGAIEDLPPERRRTPAERYAHMTRPLSDDNTWRSGFEYAQTASAAVRREAFDAVGGFEEVRSGGDADLCFKLARAGWTVERRPQAVVLHRSRTTIRGLVRQYVRYGSGTAWLESRYPGFAPPLRGPRILIGVVKGQITAAGALLRGDADRAVRLAIDPVCSAAFDVGRHLSNRAQRRKQ